MLTREEKYQNDSRLLNKRTTKNQNLYDKINESTLANFDINSNVAIVGEYKKDIDVEEIKSILERKYREEPKRRSIKIEPEDNIYEEEKNNDLTKEYDLNIVLERAHAENDEPDYNLERLKKLRMTQYDILKNLNINNLPSESEEKKEEPDLMTLIKIANKEPLNDNNIDPLDILTDLKGSENTAVFEGISSLTDNSLPEIIKEQKQEPVKEEKVEEKKEVKDNPRKDIDNSFFTESVKIEKNDFDNINIKDLENKKSFSWILIVITIIVFTIGGVILLNSLLNLGLF